MSKSAAFSKGRLRFNRFFSLFTGSKLTFTLPAYPRYPESATQFATMGRNLYILAATLGTLALVSIILSFTNIAAQPGSPGDAALWRMTSIALLLVALVVTLLGILSSLFDQAERRHSATRQQRRRRGNPEQH
jgi:magnesium-transporting ATPase (P-type)